MPKLNASKSTIVSVSRRIGFCPYIRLPTNYKNISPDRRLAGLNRRGSRRKPRLESGLFSWKKGWTMSEPKYGGCQCGAIRYRANSLWDNSHVCHCRMCQKASGNFFLALVGVTLTDLSWTRGQPAAYSSSEHVERGFCETCGTPLFFRHDQSSHITMTIGSFDNPENIALKFQLGIEARLPQIDQLAELPNHGTTEEDDTEGATAIKTSNRQHPDHETSKWPLLG